MKKPLLLLFVLSSFLGNAQKAIILQPGSEGKDAHVGWIESSFYSGDWQNINYGNADYLAGNAWTWNGSEGYSRFFLQFDLSSIPQGSEIISAKLSMFHSGYSSETQSCLSGSNEMIIQRVLDNWDESTITWNNQPTVTDENQITTPELTASFENLIDFDITTLVNDVFEKYPNYGFRFKLATEEKYRRMHFASSDFKDAAKRPKLEVTYNEPIDTCYVTVYDTIRVAVYDTVHVTVYDTLYTAVSVSDTLVIDASFSGTERIKFSGAVKMFPNPTKSDLNISVDNVAGFSGYSIKIVSSDSKVVFETAIDKSNYLVSFDSFALRGIYIVQILDPHSTIVETRKILLE